MSTFHNIPSKEVLREETLLEFQRFCEYSQIQYSLNHVLVVVVPDQNVFSTIPFRSSLLLTETFSSTQKYLHQKFYENSSYKWIKNLLINAISLMTTLLLYLGFLSIAVPCIIFLAIYNLLTAPKFLYYLIFDFPYEMYAAENTDLVRVCLVATESGLFVYKRHLPRLTVYFFQDCSYYDYVPEKIKECAFYEWVDVHFRIQYTDLGKNFSAIGLKSCDIRVPKRTKEIIKNIKPLEEV
eukprot:snap_masked-scaffold_25-processed-gene-1.3-mRNA-1 protein AED:1.00 eAED:1.00 QI:0/-1/0/0/-1/1/1/0/238